MKERTMRVGKSKWAFALGAGLAASAAFGPGCTASKQTELVPGISTQVKVPKDLQSIVIYAQVDGVLQFCQAYDVINGVASLPSTLGVVNGGGKRINITVAGYPLSTSDPNAAPEQSTGCAASPIPTVKDAKHPQGTARVLRAALTQYTPNHIKFLPMPLKYACFDTQCDAQGSTCKGGACVPADVDSSKLPDYNRELAFGDSSTCFSPSNCLPPFPLSTIPAEIDPSTCTFQVTAPQGAPPVAGAGLNVRAVFDDGSESEVLDLDPDDGYAVPDAAKPQTFRLSAGLCALYHPERLPRDQRPAHRIVALYASALCASKTPYQPLCDEESPSNPDSGAGAPSNKDLTGCQAVEVTPAPSALAVLYDDTAEMQAAGFLGDTAATQVINLSLGDPVFQNTVIGLQFFPNPAFTCAAPPTGFDVAPKIALDDPSTTPPTQGAQSLIATKLKTQQAVNAADRAYFVAADFAYKQLTSLGAKYGYAERGVIIVSNGDFKGTTCGGPNDLLAVVQAHPDIKTYAILFGKAAPSGGGDPPANPDGLDGIGALAAAGAYVQNADAFTPARDDSRPNNAATVLTRVTTDLASCMYQAPGSACTFDASNGTMSCGKGSVNGTADLTYFNPLAQAEVAIHYNKDCSAANDADGWNVDTTNGEQRIRVCGKQAGQSCDALRGVLSATLGFAAQTKTKPLAVPVYLTNCPAKPSPPAPDAGALDASTGADSSVPDGSAGDGAADAGPIQDASGGG